MISIKQWLFEKGNWQIFLSAILLGLSMAQIGLWPLAWVGFIPALMTLKKTPILKQAWIKGLLFGAIYYSMVFSWFFGLHPLTWMGISSEASLALTLGIWIIAFLTQALIVSVIWMGFYRLNQIRTPWGLLALGPFLWVAGLWFLNQNPIGLPWGFLSYAQAAAPWIRQSAFGLHFEGLEMMILAVNISLFTALDLNKKRYAALAIFLFMSVCCMGATHHPQKSHVFKTLDPIGIQGNLSLETERLKMTENDKTAYYRHLEEQALAKSQTAHGLILFPEGVLILPLNTQEVAFQQAGVSADALLSGGVLMTAQGFYNGAVLFQKASPTQFFEKRYLVPFGETTPFIPEAWLIDFLRQWNIAYGSGFLKGSFQQAPFTLGTAKIGPFICFEALYPNLVSQYKAAHVKLLVTLSNLGWYHCNRLLEKQFLAINQLRAAEMGRPLILMTNTGVSAFISERGEVLQQSDSGKVEALTCREKIPL